MRRKEKLVPEGEETDLIIAECDVCRLAFADNGYPYIVALNFGYQPGENPRLYFHCALEGKKLTMMAINNYVCFQMDTGHNLYKGEKGCDWGMNYRSVVGYGHLRKAATDEEKTEGLKTIMKHYSGERNFDFNKSSFDRACVLILDISVITAKKG